MRPVGNALELKLCKIPTIGTQSENQTLPTGNISLGSPIVFSGWALHQLGCSHNLLRFAWIAQRTSLNTIFISLKP
ncbi:hypothetical protein EPC74_03700 [Helicobacter pylori]|nr:hypothetical protein EPC72_03395 [Helicobacter pylori]KAA6511249.1 hypothetical protein EPC74_03700 [Helicobacter pylori]NHB40105.1 hypothetical protein [Helicobacter pylori]